MRTTAGLVRGVVDDQVRRFSGVPYAAPPVGQLRWRAPQPVRPWPDVRDAGKFAPPCRQAVGEIQHSSEDCLHLNVTTPLRGRWPKPVMVWLHGGGNFGGTGNEVDARRMVTSGDVVVVTINYRLGVFGFFGHPGLADSGSFGLLDQQAALRWVRDNAAAFGGDPRNVTLFGESAGGIDGCAQLTSPRARGLFDKVILQSGSCSFPGWGIVPGIWGTTSEPARAGGAARSYWPARQEVVASGANAATELGCPAGPDALACLRELPAEALLGRMTEFGAPAAGTATLPLDPGHAVAAGAFHRVPVLTGHTRDEARLVTAWSELPDKPITEQRFHALTEQAFGEHAELVRRRYPLTDHGSPALAWAALDTDRGMACPQLRDARAFAARMPAYAYEFADRTAPPYAPLPPGSMPDGAGHGAELTYLFDMAGKPVDWNGKLVPHTEPQRALAATMIGYWTRFARTGDPNGQAPRWLPVDRDAPRSQELRTGADGVGPVDAWSAHQCAFWATIGT
ncbi:carboxylesterase family protein [Crossiella sp. SN42]|uniref:carboxylesterase/lipase family protein n=1 Tax=Crossiella sp. SN42 TaxID=2944808 RepID=UPI00207CAB36|nr:carboxylesterase family protein [Crossiella sp. SN42]MCO1574559.1 carboxylesterase family protein [Crossiella sp. SN42]